MTLRTRVLGLAGTLALLFLSLIALTLTFLSRTSSQLNLLTQKDLAEEKTAEVLHLAILQIRSDIWDTMVFDLDHRARQIEELDSQAKAFYQGLRDLADVEPRFSQTAQELRALFQSYYQFGSTILQLSTLEDFVGQSQLVHKFRQNQTDLLDKLSQTLAETKNQFFGSMDTLNASFATATLLAFASSGIVTLFSFVLALLMARRLTRPLERLTSTASQVSSGDYSVRPPLTSSGEIRALTETFITMLDQIEDYSRRMEDLVRARTDTLERTNAVMIKELKLAQKIQEALIPHFFPETGPLVVAAAYLPMEELGGDFYDIFESSPGHWTIVMADVSGHGVPAALVTAMVKISLGLHGAHSPSPGRVLEEVNRELCAAIGDLRRYVTMVLFNLDLTAGTLSYCSAGHNEFVLVRNTGVCETHGPNSGVVGLRSDELFLTRTLAFNPGDGLVVFTDGLIEGRGRDHHQFGLDWLVGLISSRQNQGPEALVEAITTEVQTLFGGHPRQDDIAFLALRWKEREVETRKAVAKTPRRLKSSPTLNKAEELYRNHDFEGLLAWTEFRLGENPLASEASRIRHWQAMGLQHFGRNEEAWSIWNQALVDDPDNHRARRNRDLMARHLGKAHR